MIGKSLIALCAVAIIMIGLYALAVIAIKLFIKARALFNDDRQRQIAETRELKDALAEVKAAIDREQRIERI